MKNIKYDDFPFQQAKKDNTNLSNHVLKNTAITVGVVTLATFVSFTLRTLLHLNESSYIITYMLSVLLVAYLTKGYSYGIIASVLSVLVFNFFFTEPYYTLLACPKERS